VERLNENALLCCKHNFLSKSFLVENFHPILLTTNAQSHSCRCRSIDIALLNTANADVKKEGVSMFKGEWRVVSQKQQHDVLSQKN